MAWERSRGSQAASSQITFSPSSGCIPTLSNAAGHYARRDYVCLGLASGRVRRSHLLQGVRMFVTYLRRELRRRARQSSIIALGLALGIGLVITVTALSAGVKDAQSNVLHSLYGLDTSITVTQAPTFTGGPGSQGFRLRFGDAGNGSAPKAGTTVSVDNLSSTGYGILSSGDVSTVS